MKTKKILTVLSGLLILSSIGYSATRARIINSKKSRARISKQGNLLRKFMCKGNQNVTVENLSTKKVRLADGYGGIHELNITKSASGEKYVNKNISIHIAGKEAIYTEKGTEKNCTLQKTEHGSIKL